MGRLAQAPSEKSEFWESTKTQEVTFLAGPRHHVMFDLLIGNSLLRSIIEIWGVYHGYIKKTECRSARHT